MYSFDLISGNEKNNLLFILNNKNLFPCIEGDELVIYFDSITFFRKSICDLNIIDLGDILGFPIIESKYVYYLISIAYDNSDYKKYTKKSL